jgi:sarcosine oxidase subunit beta
MIKTEVLIVGGGIIGCSIAYYLAKEGIETVLVEKDDIASGASGACDGFIFLQSKTPGIHLEMTLKSAELYENLASELGYGLEHRKCGGMVAAEKKEELSYLNNLAERQQRFGLNVKILSEVEARSKVPGLASHIMGASFCSQDSQVNPILVTLAFAEEASKKSAKILTGAPVSKMEVSGRGKEKFVRNAITSKGKIKADLVINASGAEASKISEMAGIDLPITPRRGQILVTEPLPRVIDCLLMNVSYLTAKFRQGVKISLDSGVTFEQTEAGNLLIGNTREFVGYNKRTTYEGITSIASSAVKFFPRSKNFKIIRAFAGLRPYTPDNLSILGYVNGVKNFIVASGHEGDGIALAPITGKLIAELIVDGKTSIDISELSPNRFQKGPPTRFS